MKFQTNHTLLNTGLLLISQYLSWLYFAVIYPQASLLGLSPSLSFIHVFVEWCAVALIYNIFWGTNRFLNALCHAFAFQVLLVQTTQFLSLYNSQDYINAISLGHAGLIGLLFTWEMVGLFAASFLVPAIILHFSARWPARKRSGPGLGKKLALVGANFFALALILVVKNNALIFKLERLSFPANRDSMVAAFWSEVAKYGKVTRVEEPVITLSEKERALLAEHGIFIGQNPKLPLVKDFIYQSDLLFKTKPFAPTDKNMIVIFAESLNARMLESYNPARQGLTPNIARFAEDAMQVENYLNHAFPTIIGLRGQLCSIFPSMNNGVWNKGRSKFKTAKNKCMPRILDKNGFDTLYFGYSHPNETFFDAQMREFGFKQTYFYDELLAKFHPDRPSPGRGHYGNSDQQMFESLIGFLENRASQKRFFLAMSTIETHPGMDVLEPEKLKDRFDSPVLRLIHNFDEQFGKFWSYFQRSKYSDNTIIVLTADHAHVPNMDYIKVAGDDYGRDRYFDPVTLIIHDPTRESPKKFSTQGSSIDFAPSMLQLLDIPNESNHFLGLSLFSDRIKAKGALGIINKSRFLVNRTPGETKQPTFQIKSLSLESCASTKPPHDWPLCALYRGIRFTQGLSEKDQLYAEE